MRSSRWAGTASRAAMATTRTSAARASTTNRPGWLLQAGPGPGSRAPPMRSKGFTLVEILVVVVIMAFVISVAVLSVGTAGRDSQLDEESRRLDGLIGLLHDRAALEGRDFGLRIEPSAYEFLSYDSARDRWIPLSREGEFRRRTLPKGVSFQLELDSQQVIIKPIDTSQRGGPAASADRDRRKRRRH